MRRMPVDLAEDGFDEDAQKEDDPRPGGDGGRRGAAPGGSSRSHSAVTGGCNRRGSASMSRSRHHALISKSLDKAVVGTPHMKRGLP